MLKHVKHPTMETLRPLDRLLAAWGNLFWPRGALGARWFHAGEAATEEEHRTTVYILYLYYLYIYLIICDVLSMYIMYVQYDSYNNYILILHINIVLMVTSNDKKCVARGHWLRKRTRTLAVRYDSFQRVKWRNPIDIFSTFTLGVNRKWRNPFHKCCISSQKEIAARSAPGTSIYISCPYSTYAPHIHH